ncbi:MAG TPA: carboxypeptidase-like regulatory domain-containing protein, partial [Vicinamibacterales bacterium]
MRRLKLWTCVLLAVLALAARASAAGFAGRVLFADQPVPGATVIATKGDRQVTTVTDEHGAFTFADLENGTWSIRVEMPTFVTVTHDVTIPADAPPVWTLTLKSLEELKAERPSAPPETVAAASPATGTTPPPAAPTAAPRPATTSPTAAAISTTNAPVPAVDQPAADANDGMVINGSVNNAAASPIAQSPAFGNNRRQGRSLYSGGIGFIYGNSALDSRPFAFGGVEPAKPNYQNARVTASFGGPIKLSQTLRKDPTVFISCQRAGDNSASTQSAVLPTMAERTGNFSGVLNAAGQPVRVIDPRTGLPFSGNVIPGFRISPQAQALLALFPLPTIDGEN